MEKEELREYLLARCIKNKNGCWEWTLSRAQGYGKFMNKQRKRVMAHRESYKAFIGEIPKGLLVCHSCDNRLCINPDHLFLGTYKDNMDDMVKKGRNNYVVHLFNNYRSKKVIANYIEYISYKEAGRALGVADNTIRKRIKRGVKGYMCVD